MLLDNEETAVIYKMDSCHHLYEKEWQKPEAPQQ